MHSTIDILDLMDSSIQHDGFDSIQTFIATQYFPLSFCSYSKSIN